MVRAIGRCYAQPGYKSPEQRASSPNGHLIALVRRMVGGRTDGPLDVLRGEFRGTFAVDGTKAVHTAAAPGATNVALDVTDLRGPARRARSRPTRARMLSSNRPNAHGGHYRAIRDYVSMTTLRLRPDELELVARMIDKRDSAFLSGHRDDPFRVGMPNGTQWALQYPGRNGGEVVPSRTIERLRELGLFQGVRVGRGAMTFHLADGIGDRLEQLRDQAGQPSEVARERDARSRAEDQLSRLQVQVERDARARAERRQAFSSRLGRWGFRMTTASLVAVYLAAVILSTLSASPTLGAIVGVAVLAGLGIAEWGFHRDAFGWAHAAERWTFARVDRWLERFEGRSRSES